MSEEIEPEIAAYKRASFAFLAPPWGGRVLDVGCGTGDDVRALARMVGEGGEAVGIDRDEQLIEAARVRLADVPNARLEVADAHVLPFADAIFDSVRSDRTLQHVVAPDIAIGEMWRVLRPGGRMYVFEPDWGTMMVNSPADDVTRRIVAFKADREHRNGLLGRRLPAMLRALGAPELRIDPHVWILTDFETADPLAGLSSAVRAAAEKGAISEADGSMWLVALMRLSAEGAFLASLNGYGYGVHKPAE